MVISQPPGNNPSYYYRASPTLPIALNASRDTLCSIQGNYNIRVTHRNGANKHILHESDPRRDHQQIVLYRLCRSNKYCSSSKRLKYYSNLSVWRFEHVTYICRLYFPSRMPAGPHFVTQPILLWKTFLIFDITINKTQGGQTRLKR